MCYLVGDLLLLIIVCCLIVLLFCGLRVECGCGVVACRFDVWWLGCWLIAGLVFVLIRVVLLVDLVGCLFSGCWGGG